MFQTPLQIPTPSWRDEEELNIFNDSVEQFLIRECVPHLEEWREAGIVPRGFWTKAGEMGLLCPSTPEEYGGLGGDFRHEAIITEQLEWHGFVGWAIGLHNCIVAPYILDYGTEEQKQKWLPKLASGEMVGAIAMTEPGTGSDLQSVKTSALKDGDDYILSGSKTFITNGQNADLIVVVAKTDPKARGKGVSLIVLETASAPGFERGRNLKKVGQPMADTSELFFNDVRIPQSNLLGGVEGKGFAQLMNQLPQERHMIGIQATAMIERALAETLKYVKEREAFGKPILDFQNTQFKLADIKTKATIARVFCDHCTDQLLQGKLDSVTASMSKMYLTDLQVEVVDTCLQFFGGYGYMDEFPIAQMFQDARVQTIYGGTNEIMKLLIARSL